jgi:hypothetical protein
MPCPRCDYGNPPEARFCARCGTRLDGGAAATVELDEPGETKELRTQPEERQKAQRTAAPPFEVPAAELITSARRALVGGGWFAGLGAAAIGLAVAWACGAALVLAAKLEAPALGSGAGFFDVLRAVALAGLACLRVPVEVGGAELTVLPLGALAVIGWALVAATAEQVARRDPAGYSRRAGALEGAKTGAGLALLCLVSALVFRFGGARPVAADPALALLLGGLWGALFGALGGLRGRGEGPSAWWGLALARLSRLGPGAVAGANAGLLALVLMGLSAASLALLRVIVALAAGGAGLSLGRVVAVVVYAVAFLPNIVVAIAALGLGAPVHVGARLTGAGRLLDAGASHSLLSWDGGPAPAWALLALLIPIAAFALASFSARRSAGPTADVRLVLGTLALLVALVLATVALLGEARLVGAALGRGGFVRVAASPGWTFALALVWGLALGWVGWRLAAAEPR